MNFVVLLTRVEMLVDWIWWHIGIYSKWLSRQLFALDGNRPSAVTNSTHGSSSRTVCVSDIACLVFRRFQPMNHSPSSGYIDAIGLGNRARPRHG